MTYRNLILTLLTLSSEQLDSDVTLFDNNNGEWCPAQLSFQEGDDVLHDGHPYFEEKRA